MMVLQVLRLPRETSLTVLQNEPEGAARALVMLCYVVLIMLC